MAPKQPIMAPKQPVAISDAEAAKVESAKPTTVQKQDPKTPPAPAMSGELPDTKAATAATADTQQGILQPTEKATLQGDIDQVLSQYMGELNNLGPEYGEEMKFLEPYLSSNQSAGLSAPAYTGPGAAGINTADAALSQSEKGLQSAYENMGTPGFGAAAASAKQYENTIPYQQALQAGLGYQKYLETYGGLQPGTAEWPTNIQDIYKAITGSSSNVGGLPSPIQAGAGQNANNLLQTPTNAGTGNTSGG